MEMQSLENTGSALPLVDRLPALPSAGSDTSGLTPPGTGIDVDSLATSIGLSRESIVDLLRMFVASSFDDLSRITDGILSKDLRQVADAAHSLKGAALSFELNDIASAARHIEVAAHTGVPIDLDEAIESIRHRLLLIDSATDAEECTQE
jgi:HPt (histidine-containing phosphotransfer) domain-containing protein